MSIWFISKYYSDIEKCIRFGGTSKESSIRRAFENLLNDYTQKQNLWLVPELDYRTAKGKTVRPDGTLKVAITVPTVLTDEQKKILENAAMSCPVHKSISREVNIPVEFKWGK
jgi:hypothetical protein